MSGTWRTAAVGGIAGAGAFLASLGTPVLDFRNIRWLMPEGDARIHYLGWHMFRHEPWHLPPGLTTTFGYPVGTSIGNTDSVPILALLFKALGPLLPAGDLQYFGLWLFLSFTLLGVFGALLMRTATRSLALQALGAACFVLSPLIVHRLGHIGLTAHWLLVAGLWLHFAWPGQLTSRAAWTGWACLAVVSGLTHPYLGVMVMTLAGAFGAGAVLARPRAAVRHAAALVAVTVLFTSALWTAGYFTVGGSDNLDAGGFGAYSMNLFSPFVATPGSTTYPVETFPGMPYVSFEGFAYLGAGALLLLVVAVALQAWRPRRLARSAGRHAPLLLACAFLTLMALGNRIQAGPWVLAEYDAAWLGPLRVLRANGRMFWPVAYLMLFFGLATVAGRARQRVAVGLLLVAALLQAADVRDAYAAARALGRQAWETPLRSPIWDAAVPAYGHVSLYPTNLCTVNAIDYAPFALLAGRAHATVNGAMAARYDTEGLRNFCQSYQERLVAGGVRDDELYVLQPQWGPELRAVAKEPVTCTEADGYAVCFTTASYQRWQDRFDLVRATQPPEAEIVAFYDALSRYYAERLSRPATEVAGAGPTRLETLVEFIAYRGSGCTLREAEARALDPLRGGDLLHLCDHMADGALLPDRTQVVAFQQRLQEELRQSRPAERTTTPVDGEGEAVWVLEYLRHRRAGCTAAAAQAAIFAEIGGQPIPACGQ
ncbi:MAG: DUF6311 domain-containing protein [Vicinamibacterales bacterium]